MKNKRTKSKRGRKKDSGVLSGIKPEHETFEEIRARFGWGSAQWPMAALQYLIKNGTADRDLRLPPFAPFCWLCSVSRCRQH
jgi:hypothetical protein